MSLEIYGVASREDAMTQWKPFGERAGLQPPFDDVSSYSPDDVAEIVRGASPKTQAAIYRLCDDEVRDEEKPDWLDEVRTHVETRGLTGEMEDLVRLSAEIQEVWAARQREQFIAEGPARTKLLRRALGILGSEGVLSPRHAAVMQERASGPDGMPYFETAPVTPWHYQRLHQQWARPGDPPYDLEDPLPVTIVEDGLIMLPVDQDPASRTYTSHNRLHEGVHGLQGNEFRFTNELIEPTVTGVFAADPRDGTHTYDNVSGAEINEGWTEYFTYELERVEPKLGETLPLTCSSYGPYLPILRKIDPVIMGAITNAILVDATPQDPDAKQAAIERMHAIADKRAGRKNYLGIFASAAGITDIHSAR